MIVEGVFRGGAVGCVSTGFGGVNPVLGAVGCGRARGGALRVPLFPLRARTRPPYPFP